MEVRALIMEQAPHNLVTEEQVLHTTALHTAVEEEEPRRVVIHQVPVEVGVPGREVPQAQPAGMRLGIRDLVAAEVVPLAGVEVREL